MARVSDDSPRPTFWTIVSGRPVQVLLFAGFLCAAFLRDATSGRSMGFVAIIGLWAVIHSWGMITNAGGTWDRHVSREGERGRRITKLPLGRVYWEVERSDSEFHRGMMGSAGIMAGLAFTAVGVLAALGVLHIA